MASGYGAMGDSGMNGDAGPIALVDEEDEEYDYLPLPEVDEDFLDPLDHSGSKRPAANGNERQPMLQGRPDNPIAVLKRRPFTDVHQPPVPFDSHQRHCFLPGQKISVEIINVEKNDTYSSHLMNPYLYVIQVTHGDFKWTVRRRYKHFKSLHDDLVLHRTKAMFTVATKEARDRRKTLAQAHQGVQKFPKRPEALVRAENMEERQQQLQAYLQSVLRCSQYRNHPETVCSTVLLLYLACILV